jgi:hypothetical protein
VPYAPPPMLPITNPVDVSSAAAAGEEDPL